MPDSPVYSEQSVWTLNSKMYLSPDRKWLNGKWAMTADEACRGMGVECALYQPQHIGGDWKVCGANDYSWN